MKTEVVYLNGVLLVLTSTGSNLEFERLKFIKKQSDILTKGLTPYFRCVQVIANDEVTFTNVENDK